MVHKICFPSHQSPAYRYPVLETCLTVLTCFALLGCGASSDPVDDQCELGGSILVEEGVSQDTLWDCTVAPYQVMSEFNVSAAATLTIAPGVTVEFGEDGSLVIGAEDEHGSLSAVGTADEPILFTSSAAVPAAGDWKAIVIHSGANSATIEHAIIEYGGASFNVPDYGCCTEAALLVNNSAVTLRNTIFADNVSGVLFKNGGSAVAFSDNSFSGHSEWPVQIEASQIGTLTGPNTFDSDDVVAVAGGIVSSDATWSALGAPYRLDGRVQVKGSAAPTLTIAAGVTLKMGEDTALEIGAEEQGALIADGSVAPITFTSSRESPAAGDWEAVGIYGATTEATFRSVIFEYGGASYNAPTWGCCAESLLFARSAAVTVEDSVFRNSAGHGIELGETASLTQSGNSFTDLVGEDVMQH